MFSLSDKHKQYNLYIIIILYPTIYISYDFLIESSAKAKL